MGSRESAFFAAGLRRVLVQLIAITLLIAAPLVKSIAADSWSPEHQLGGASQATLSDSNRSVRVQAGICGNAIALSDPKCKQDAKNNLEIGANGCGPNVFVDKSYVDANQFHTITIDSGATLCFPDEKLMMDVNTILINGLLKIGQKNNPIGTANPMNLVTLNFVGKRPCDAGTTCPNFSKGIQTQSGGSLRCSD